MLGNLRKPPRLSVTDGRHKRLVTTAIAVGLAASLLSACGGGGSNGGSGGAAAAGKSGGSGSSGSTTSAVLGINQSNAGPFSDNFNPLLTTSTGNTTAADNMIYEPLLQFNELKANSTLPWLAESYTITNKNKTFTFDLRPGVTWSDGQPFTSADVVFTFQTIESHSALNPNGLKFASLKADGKYKVVVTLAKSDRSALYYLGEQKIIPEHVWKDQNPLTYADPKPVGTGPYVLQTFSIQDIKLDTNPHYWGTKPAISQLNYPMYDSDSTADQSLLAGTTQLGSHNMSTVQTRFIKQSPYDHFWYLPTTTIQLMPNLTKYPLSNVDVRKAISDAIDRNLISRDAENGNEKAITSPTGLLPQYDALLSPQYKSLKYTVDDAAAIKLLEAAGLKRASNGAFEQANGQPVTISLLIPSAYFDWVTIGQILTRELAKIGIKMNVSAVNLDTWTSDEAVGDFQMTLNVGDSGPSPYYIYNGFLNDDLTSPEGQAAAGDFGRWENAATEKYLSEYNTAPSASAQTAAIQGLEKIMVQDAPVIPIINQAGWYQWVSKNVVGWPTPTSPGPVGPPDGNSSEVVVLHLKPRS